MSLEAQRISGGLVGCVQASCRRTLPGVWRVTSGLEDPWLFLGRGWMPDDKGIWRTTERAQRDGDFMLGRHGDARRHVRSHKSAPQGETAIGWRPPLPIEAICPWCGARLCLREATLGVRWWTTRRNTPCIHERCPNIAVERALCEDHQDEPGIDPLPAREVWVEREWLVSD